jgi:ABC-type multidrug transport system ATPase subunit
LREALSVRGLSFSYPAFPRGVGWLMGRPRAAVETFTGLTFGIAEGERVCLMGPNGTGKSTLLKIVLGLLAPTAGSAEVFGLDSGRREARRLVGLVHPDERSFYWRLTVRENLAFFGGLWGLPPASARARASASAETAGLQEWLDRPFSALSTGTRQKVAIARALLHEPALLLMDEPTRSLDPPSAAHLWEWLRGPACTGRALLIATHNPAEASALSDRCLVLAGGRLAHDGAPLEGRAVADLMGSRS